MHIYRWCGPSSPRRRPTQSCGRWCWSACWTRLGRSAAAACAPARCGSCPSTAPAPPTSRPRCRRARARCTCPFPGSLMSCAACLPCLIVAAYAAVTHRKTSAVGGVAPEGSATHHDLLRGATPVCEHELSVPSCVLVVLPIGAVSRWLASMLLGMLRQHERQVLLGHDRRSGRAWGRCPLCATRMSARRTAMRGTPPQTCPRTPSCPPPTAPPCCRTAPMLRRRVHMGARPSWAALHKLSTRVARLHLRSCLCRGCFA